MPASEEGGTPVSHLRDMPKMRASSRSTSEGLRLAAHGGELPREEVDRPGELLVDLSGGPYAPELPVHARHLVAEHLVDAHVGPDDDLLLEGRL